MLNMIKETQQSIEDKIKAEGKKTPLEFLLDVMHNPNNYSQLRIEAAKTAAPYVHKKMPMAMQHSGEIEFIPPYIPSRAEIKRILDAGDPDNLDDL